MQFVECVPNFSEGRDRSVIDAIATAIGCVADIKLLNIDAGIDANRTVYTFVGPPPAVVEAAVRAATTAVASIDMATHHGVHPRMGALDVCPIVPLSGVTMEKCVETAHVLGRRLANELNVPIYFYGNAATRPERRSLSAIRSGEYEGLAQRLTDPAWVPDCGPSTFNPRVGATAVGARDILIAYNVNLDTTDERLAHRIAQAIRESGAKGDGREPGRLQAVRAIGWYVAEHRRAQVSVNVLNYKVTPLHKVFETVREEAERLGLRVTGSELVGMAPLDALVTAGRFYSQGTDRRPGRAGDEELVDAAVQALGLGELAPFDAGKRIIELALQPTRR